MSNIRSARKKLSYPLYGADFDPLNHDFLIVGGGGGSTSSGVPNKITLIDASRRNELNEILDLDLSKDEDSVTSLAVASSDSSSLIAYAGINSSQKDQDAGRNEHLRSFQVGLPARKRTLTGEEKQDGTSVQGQAVRSQALGRTAMFRSASGPKNDTYQRVLRVAPAHSDERERVAAIASGLAPQNEVITFRVASSPGTSSVISRINVEQGEAADLDIIPVDDGSQSHVLAYCTDYDIFFQRIPAAGKMAPEPVKAFSVAAGANRKKIRCIRWLSHRYIAVVRNYPGRTGVDVEILKTDKGYNSALPSLVKKLTKSTKSAVGLDVVALSPPEATDQQFILAVAGQDCSVEILVADYDSTYGMRKIKQYSHLQEVHASPITKIAFSKFQPPKSPVTKQTLPQFVRLASVGVDQVVVVHTLPLRPYPATSKSPRYVLVTPPEIVQNLINIAVALLVIGITAFCMQVFCEIRGALPPLLGATNWLSPEWQERIARPYHSAKPLEAFDHIRASGPVIPESMPPIVEPASSSLDSATQSLKSAAEAASSIAAGTTNYLLSSLVDSSDSDNKVIVIRDQVDSESEENSDKASSTTGQRLLAELHDHTADTLTSLKQETVKKWDDLTEKEKKGWKKKLKDAGHWTEKEGEKILKGIFFGELAGVVGAAVRG